MAGCPALRVIVAECGLSWLPALHWRLDKDWKGIWREVPWVARPPSEFLREQVRLTTAPAHLPTDPEQLAEALDLLDPASLVLYAGDHPHVHGDGTERLLAALGPADRDAVLGGNARTFRPQWWALGPTRSSTTRPPTTRPHRREEAPR